MSVIKALKDKPVAQGNGCKVSHLCSPPGNSAKPDGNAYAGVA